MTDNPTLPDWVGEFRIRQMLWDRYGIPAADLAMSDVTKAVRLETADRRREREQVKRGAGNG